MARQTWIADRLRAYGLEVHEVDGWKTRGSDFFNPNGVVVHHTASNRYGGDVPCLHICTYGRQDLSGPLCAVLISRSGKCYVIAAGRANHAGSGGWRGLSGNSSVLGIEVENDGIGEPWSAHLMDVFFRVTHALATGIGRDHTWVCSHKEWTPRKVDPYGIDMDMFRNSVKHVSQSPAEAKPGWRYASGLPVGMYDYGPVVLEIQNRCNYWGFDAGLADSYFGAKTFSAVKKFQGQLGVETDGIWGEASESAYQLFISQLHVNDNVLASGVAMRQGEMLHAKNSLFAFAYQPDGNLVVYDRDNRAIWSTWTHGKDSDRLVMQTDGNLVLYNGTSPVWATWTEGHPKSYLVMQEDGNLVIYSSTNKALWSSKHGRTY